MYTEVLIIGAGVYGVSLANYLHHQNRSFIVAGKYMDLWRNHTFENMKLRSGFSTSGVAHPKNRFNMDLFLIENPDLKEYRNKHLPIFIYRRYLDWVESRLEFPVLDDLVDKLDHNVDEKTGKRFCAYLKNRGSNKPVYSRFVVIATGLEPHLFIPSDFGRKTENILHSYNTRDIEKLQNKKSLVVGGGQSAAECIETLRAHKNNVSWYTRHTPIFLEQPVNIPNRVFSSLINLAPVFRRIPGWIRYPLNQILSRPTIMPEYKGMLRETNLVNLPGENEVRENLFQTFDQIIAATGYKFRLDNFDFISPELRSKIRARKYLPVLDTTFQTTVPGLYFTGGISESYFGTALKFIIGSHYSAKTIAGVLKN